MKTARRLYFYVMSFAGLLTALYALTGIIGVVALTVLLGPSTLSGVSDTRSRVSLYLAMLIVGVPIFLIHWLTAERLASKSPEDRRAFPRRLFFAAVFVTTSLVALYALRGLLGYFFTLPGDLGQRTSSVSAVLNGAKAVAYATAWAFFVRIHTRTVPDADRTSDLDSPFDLAVYSLTAFSLGFLLYGLRQALRQIVQRTLDLLSGQTLLLGGVANPWDTWGSIGSWVLVGGAVWGAMWRYDLLRDQRRPLRVLYLYVVLLAGAASTLGGGAYGLYELMRRLLGYEPSDGNTWVILVNAIPLALIGGATWAYHWTVVRRQAVYDRDSHSLDEVPAGDGIAWPRRPFLVVLALSGVATAAPALVSMVWLGLDLIFNTNADLSGGSWWRDRLSYSAVGIVLGSVVWLASWWILQRAATVAPGTERTATARRVLLGLVVLGGALAAIGFAVALLWLVLRTILGDALPSSALSSGFKDFSAALVATALAVYHGLSLRNDMRAGDLRPSRITLRVLLAPGADGALEELRERLGRATHIDVIGRLGDSTPMEHHNTEALSGAIAALRQNGDGGHAVLFLRPDGGSVVPYEPDRG